MVVTILVGVGLSFFEVDMRDLRTGKMISDLNGYYDSQNIVAVWNGNHRILSVILHKSDNHEGGPGLRLYNTVSHDDGRIWSALKPIETSEIKPSHDGYQLLDKKRQRIYVFYGYNEYVECQPCKDCPHCRGKGWETPIGELLPRPDMQLSAGYYFRYSDNFGEDWSHRILIKIRRTDIDHKNAWGGDIMGMFLCDKPQIIGGSVYMAFQKTKDGAGETEGSQVFFLKSKNLLEIDNPETDPESVKWETLPVGEFGLIDEY